MAERDGKILVTTPDLITLLEAESGAPVTADSLRYGLRLKALAFPSDPQWRTPAGIALVGPRLLRLRCRLHALRLRSGLGFA